MFRRFTERFLRLSLRLWPLILLVAIGTGIPAFQGTVRLFKNIDTDLANLLPDSYRSVQVIQKVRDKMASKGSLKIILEGPDRETILPYLQDLVEHFKGIEEIYKVEYLKPGYDFFDEHKMLYVSLEDLEDIRDRMDRKIQREKLGSLYISFEDDEPQTFNELLEKYKGEYSSGVRSSYYESDDGTLFLIDLEPKGEASDLAYAEKFFKKIRQEIKTFAPPSRDERIVFYYVGSIRSRVDEYHSLIGDLSQAGIIAGIGILILLILVLRGLRPILMVLGPLTLGIFYTFGLAGLFVESLNTVTAFMFAIMMGLGIDFGIHKVSRYLEGRSRGKSIAESLFDVSYHIGRASATSAVTTATAFLLLLLVDFKGFSEFGLIAGIGIITAFLTYWVYLPAWITLLEKLGPIKRAPVSFLKFFDRRSRFPRPKLVFGLAASLSLVSLILVTQVSFEYDYGKLRAHLPEANLAREKYQKIKKRRPRPAVVILNDEKEAAAVKEAVDKIGDNPDSIVDKFASLYSLVPGDQEKKQELMSEIDALLQDDVIQKLVKGEDKEDIDEFQESLHISSVTLDDVPGEAKEPFIGNPDIPGSLGLIFPKAGIELHDGRNAIQLADEIQTLETSLGPFDTSSDSIIFANVLTVMLQDTRIAIPLAFLGVLLLLIVDFRKFRDVAVVVMPWISGVLWMASAMVIFGFKLNFYNVFIPAAIFGMGIDYSVHLFHRYREDRADVVPALHSAGTAIVIAALTTMIGFSGLALASHRGLRSMGLLAIIGIASCMVCSLTMLPASLEIWHRRGKSEPDNI